MAASIEAIIFDIDGVLCATDFEKRLALLAAELGIAVDVIEREIFNSGCEDDADMGKLSAADYVAGIGHRLGVAVSAEVWLKARIDAMTPDPGMLDLARDLAGHVATVMLTNNGHLLAEHMAEVFPDVLSLFGERALFSARLGMGKQQPATYPALARRFGWRVDRMLLIDDSETYVAAAREAGTVGHLFRGIDGLRAELGGLGL